MILGLVTLSLKDILIMVYGFSYNILWRINEACYTVIIYEMAVQIIWHVYDAL